MTFIETNVFLFAVGRSHPLREEALRVLDRGMRSSTEFVTSAEVLQEVLHVFSRRRLLERCDDAFGLVERVVSDVWSLEPEDVALARTLADRHPELEARDLVHLACCLRRQATDLVTFDRGLAAAWARRSRSRP
ncbi:MAG: type II toxin-antitoxin system VapC family toxin [Acidobacteriota bacterium]|nr:type II toxin-antitoxin system VapC family toxin [Acidobacteriota bacterium]MDE3262979.1 type II toxin-antitoxin system VapC family toxin [Acidobacteriota bacterium]